MFVTIYVVFSLVVAILTSKINAFMGRLNMLFYIFFMPDFIVTNVTAVNHTFVLNLRMSFGIAFLTKIIVALITLVLLSTLGHGSSFCKQLSPIQLLKRMNLIITKIQAARKKWQTYAFEFVHRHKLMLRQGNNFLSEVAGNMC